MPADPNHITVRITLKNRKAVREFIRAVELIAEAAADHRRRTDIQRALKLLRRCGRALQPVNRKR